MKWAESRTGKTVDKPIGEAKPNIFEDDDGKIRNLFPCLLQDEFKTHENVSYWNGFHLLTVLGFSTLLIGLFLTVPQHDVVKSPEYWYELIIAFILLAPLNLVLKLLQNCNTSFKIRSIISFKTFLRLSLVTVLGFVVPYCFYYLIWTICLGFNPPMPFSSACGYPMLPLLLSALWFEFPKDLRTDKVFQKRIQFFILSIAWSGAIKFQYQFLSTLFKKLPIQLQWLMAIILPVIRYLNLFK